MRKPRNPKYTIRAYYTENSVTRPFWCSESVMKNITNELGASMPLANGERLLETDSRIDFMQNAQVTIGGETLRVKQTNSVVDRKDKNSMRGKPSYITTVLIY